MNDESKESSENETNDLKIESLKWAIFVCFIGLAMIVYPIPLYVTPYDGWLYYVSSSKIGAILWLWSRPFGICIMIIGIASVENILWKGWIFWLLEQVCTTIDWLYKHLCCYWDNFITRKTE